MNSIKKWGIGLSIFSLLFLFCIVIFGLGHAYWSIHQPAAPLPSNKELTNLLKINDGPTSIHYLTTATVQDKKRGEIVYPSFVIQWADGRRFLIDIGMDNKGALDFFQKMAWQYDSEGIQSHGSTKQQLGQSSVSVSGMAFTHLHTDHMQGIQSYCQPTSSNITLFQTAQQALQRNYTTLPGAVLISNTTCIEPLVLPDEKALIPIPGFPGLAAFTVAGHTPGSTAYVVAVNGKLWIIAGDVSWQRSALLENKPKSVSTLRSIMFPENQSRLTQLRQWFTEKESQANAHVLLCHDGKALRQFGPPIFNAKE